MTNNSTLSTFKPTLIIHGGAGDIHRSTLPPDLYAQYHSSLQAYLRSTKDLLYNGTTALDTAVHAVSLLEDDELFNCGRGSVFTSAGTIEMEASVMVSSVHKNNNNVTNDTQETIKRGTGVMGLRDIRHPIRLARESLLRTGHDANGKPNGNGGIMHAQLAAPYIENLAREWGLESMPDKWFWTQKRWDEHRRGLEGEKEPVFMSQGTVGCVCLDRWGNLAVATSTGGWVTNKWPGRIGDTPTLGAGFWAEAWDVVSPLEDGGAMQPSRTSIVTSAWDLAQGIRHLFADCMPPFMQNAPLQMSDEPEESQRTLIDHEKQLQPPHYPRKRRAVALSGTGNGNSFLRIAAARTASAMLRFASSPGTNTTLAEAVTAVAGPGGELQSSAGRRWGVTDEGAGGIIGIEAEGVDVQTGGSLSRGHEKGGYLRRGKVIVDFNYGGMWRTWG